MRLRRNFILACAGLGLGTLGLTGALKATDLVGFSAALKGWTILPPWSAVPLALAIPALELFLAAGWFGGRRREVFEVWGLSLGCILLLGASLQSQAGMPADCGCLGALNQFLQAKSAAVSSVVLSAGVTALLGAAFVARALGPRGRTGGNKTSADSPSRSRASAPGFTLLETLLVIVIITLLSVLLLPSLAGVNSAALATKTASNLRQSAATITVYAQDWRDSFPAFLDPRAASTSLYVSALDRFVTAERYFLGYSYWRYALAPGYLDGDPFATWVFPAEVLRAGTPFGEPFLLSCTTFAHPQYWNLRTRTGREQLGATSHSQVHYPSEKGLFLSKGNHDRLREREGVRRIDRDSDSVRYPMAMMDGSVRDMLGRDILPGVMTGEGNYPTSFHLIDWPYGMHTEDGLRGRDVP